jgi:hypothetical protein
MEGFCMNSLQEELLEAADKLRQCDNWARNPQAGGRCAVYEVTGRVAPRRLVSFDLHETVDRWLRDREIARSLIAFNDHVAETADDVAVLFEKVAADL